MSARKELTPAQYARARHLYEQTLAPVVQIAASCDVSDTWLYNLIKKEDWPRRRGKSADFHFARAMSEASARGPAGMDELLPPARSSNRETLDAARLALAVRLHESADKVLEAVIRVVAVISPADQAEAERSARTLAQIAHALREVAYLKEPEGVAVADDSNEDDPVPRDLDEFRQELARRIRGFIESRRTIPVGFSEPPGRPLD